MRVHISLDADLVDELDRLAGKRRRSDFIAASVRRALDDERRWGEVEASLGSFPDSGHDRDDDPAAWVRSQRHVGARRAG